MALGVGGEGMLEKLCVKIGVQHLVLKILLP